MTVLIFIIAAMIGSFLAAATYRYERNIQFVSGRSFCDSCKKELTWYDNIPILSYLFYLGNSRCCGKKISVRYFLIELSSALAAVFLYINQPAIQFVLSYLLFLILLAIFVIDFETQIIPDELVWFGIAVATFQNKYSLYETLLSGLIAALFLLLVHLATRGRGMGLGDVKFAILGGMIVGAKLLFVWLFLSFLTGAIVGIILILAKAAKLKQKIAFGPFLIVSIYLTLIYGEKILFWFYSY